eukprot:TRINITY_DN6593_c0_g1_i1.p1 TRINITY_DN6593_c0_g1~~TRINITY_DN6593_c0_g1_i1.p1  ORF type:complete len:255 (-),score=67.61 TRINITY_DN6593_c0_g1_i1:125-823(-)
MNMLSRVQTVAFRRGTLQQLCYPLPLINIQKRGVKTRKRFSSEGPKPPGSVVLEQTYNSQTPDPNISYISHSQLKGLLDNNTKNNLVLIDVRNEWELGVEPSIQGSLNIPVEPPPLLEKPKKKKVDKKKGKGKQTQKEEEKAEEAPQDLFREAYFLPDDRWQSRFKKPKPQFEDNVVLVSTTHDEPRSLKVYQSAAQLGFSNLKLLTGGIRVWNKYQNNENTKTTTSTSETK